MAKKESANSLLPALVKEAFSRELFETRNKGGEKSRDYLTTGMVNFSNQPVTWTVDGVEYTGNAGGQMVVNVIGIRKTAEITQKKAATIEQQFDSLSAAEQSALAEKLLARVK